MYTSSDCKFCHRHVFDCDLYSHQRNCHKKLLDEQKQLSQQWEKPLDVQQNLGTQNKQTQIEFINKYLDIKEILKKGDELFRTAKFLQQKFDNQPFDKCNVCTIEFIYYDNVIYTTCCQHLFHIKCFNSKLRQSTQCYNCKSELFNLKLFEDSHDYY